MIKKTILLLGVSLAFSANAVIDAKIKTDVKVSEVHCVSPQNQGHDEAFAGGAFFETADGIIKANIYISRFKDVKSTARRLCKQLKSLKKSQKSTNLIYIEVTDEHGGVNTRILGVGDLPGANPLNEG
jgi:hypothetical protein